MKYNIQNKLIYKYNFNTVILRRNIYQNMLLFVQINMVVLGIFFYKNIIFCCIIIIKKNYLLISL